MDERDDEGTQHQEEQLAVAKQEAEEGKQPADAQLDDELHTEGGGETTSRDSDETLTGTDPGARGQNEA